MFRRTAVLPGDGISVDVPDQYAATKQSHGQQNPSQPPLRRAHVVPLSATKKAQHFLSRGPPMSFDDSRRYLRRSSDALLPSSCLRSPPPAFTSVSTAAALCSGARCAYRSVIAIDLCPSSSRTVLRSTPAMTSLLANVCRRSWKRKFVTCADFSTPPTPS